MNLRDSVWIALSELAEEADCLLLGRRSLPDLDQVLQFVRRLRSVLRRLTMPKSRLRAPALTRELEELMADCAGSLEVLRPKLEAAHRRARALAERNRRIVRNGQGAGT